MTDHNKPPEGWTGKRITQPQTVVHANGDGTGRSAPHPTKRVLGTLWTSPEGSTHRWCPDEPMEWHGPKPGELARKMKQLLGPSK